MSIRTASWEHRLLELAYQGIESQPVEDCVEADPLTMQQAYVQCAAMTKVHSRTFYLASGLLSKKKRAAVRALYAFCRVTDDLVDRATGDAADRNLLAWRQRIIQDCPEPYDAIALAWNDTQIAYGIPSLYAEQLIDGVARDLVQTRYATFEDLTAYCYGVASTVGLMSMHIIGFDKEAAIPYAVKLGVALQLTNILRDVAEDWESGRLYLPLDELDAYGLTEADIEAGRVDERWQAFMRFQIDRVRRLYAESLPGIVHLHSDGRFSINAAAELYRAILDDIEAHAMDNLHRRAYTSIWEKLQRLPGIWWRANVRYPSNVL